MRKLLICSARCSRQCTLSPGWCGTAIACGPDGRGVLWVCSCEAEGELSPSTAPVYYQYGLALLSQVQNSSDAFGGAVKKSDGTPGVAPPAGANSSREESLEIAWEVLDVARVIYSRGVRAWPRAAVVCRPAHAAHTPTGRRAAAGVCAFRAWSDVSRERWVCCGSPVGMGDFAHVPPTYLDRQLRGGILGFQ